MYRFLALVSIVIMSCTPEAETSVPPAADDAGGVAGAGGSGGVAPGSAGGGADGGAGGSEAGGSGGEGVTYYPATGEAWRAATPESQGMSLSDLESSRSQMATYTGEPLTSVTGIVVRNGYEVWRYGDPYAERKGWASCSRSIMTTQFGMAIHEGLIAGDQSSVELPVSQIDGPEAGTYDDEILLKHLLSYTSCANPPGSGWSYSCNFFSMHKIIEDLDGAFPIFRIEQILGPAIGADFRAIEYWGSDNQFESPLAIVEATEADAARWGYLWLKRGTWANQQIVDAWFVDRSVQPMPSPVGGYAHGNEGWQIHLNANGMWGDLIPHDAYSALGASGSVIFVCPSLELIAALKVAPHPYGHVEVGDEIHRDIRNLIEPIIEAVVAP